MYIPLSERFKGIKIDEIIMYLRKSRAERNETVEGVLARHEKILQDFALENFGFKIPEKNIYREVVSGETIEERIEIKKVFSRLEKEDIKICLVVEPQRLSRGDLLDCGRVVHIFKYSDTLVTTVTKTYDLNDKFDRQLFENQLMQGNQYLEYQKEIMDRGKALSLREGKFISSTPPFGYGREPLEKGYKLVINPEEAPTVKIMFELFVDEDLSTQEVADYLNKHHFKSRSGKLWDYEMVREKLKNEAYYGKVAWGKRPTMKKLVNGELTKFRQSADDYMLVEGLHEAIITKEMFDAAQAKIKGHKCSRTGLNRELQNPLAGLVYCKKCGRALVRIKNTRTDNRKKVRKYEVDKKAINTLLREHKGKWKYTQIADELGISKHSVTQWFSPTYEKIYYNETFSQAWYGLKELLGITTNEYDKQIMTFVDPPPLKDSYHCSNPNCDMVSSCLQTVEKEIVNKLKETLKDFNYYIDNYEEEIIKERVSNTKTITKLNNKIEGLKKELKNLRRAYNREEFTYEEYVEDKKDIEEELHNLQQQLEEFESDEELDTLTRYKKAIPKLEKVIKDYHKLSIVEKNKLLKSIIEKVIYSKSVRMNWRKNIEDDMELEIHLNI